MVRVCHWACGRTGARPVALFVLVVLIPDNHHRHTFRAMSHPKDLGFKMIDCSTRALSWGTNLWLETPFSVKTRGERRQMDVFVDFPSSGTGGVFDMASVSTPAENVIFLDTDVPPFVSSDVSMDSQSFSEALQQPHTTDPVAPPYSLPPAASSFSSDLSHSGWSSSHGKAKKQRRYVSFRLTVVFVSVCDLRPPG